MGNLHANTRPPMLTDNDDFYQQVSRTLFYLRFHFVTEITSMIHLHFLPYNIGSFSFYRPVTVMIDSCVYRAYSSIRISISFYL